MSQNHSQNLNVAPLPLSKPIWQRSVGDWCHALFVVLLTVIVFRQYGGIMDIYEKAILLGVTPMLIVLGFALKGLRVLVPVVTLSVAIAIKLYAGDLLNAEKVKLLKIAFGSQSAILSMGVCFWIATIIYWLGFFSRKNLVSLIASAFTWVAFGFGFIGLFVRWHESHLMGANIGYIPVSNLYEVFILFSLITTGFYLYYEQLYKTRQLGGFVLLIVSTAIAFIFWYTFSRNNAQIQPLVPALQSWWMKIHVPANFVGYGTFSLAAMIALAWLLQNASTRSLWLGLIFVPLGLLVLAWLITVGFLGGDGIAKGWVAYQAQISNPEGDVKKFFGMMRTTYLTIGLLIVFLACVVARHSIKVRLPASDVLDEIMYKAIAVGFAFFTIATILGALWANEAWGRYWQWDPKEVWALIVWINYAAWLHFRLISGVRGAATAWWAFIGLFVTTFAFLGVNMFLSGLHSYGAL